MVTIGNYSFQGPFNSTSFLQDVAGVYAILDCLPSVSSRVLDIGESNAVRTRIENHDRSECWKVNSRGTIGVAVLYTPSVGRPGRMAIEAALRSQYRPRCGIQ